MPKGFLFWVIMILALLFCLFSGFQSSPWRYASLANYATLWVLLALLGWQVFGSAVK